MPAIKDNKKNKIVFYILIFIFLSTVSFFEKTNIFGNKVFFKLNEIKISGYKKINHTEMQGKLNNLIGKNLLLIKIKDVEDIISEYKLISQYTIKKHFPNKIHIKLKETTLLAKLIKDKKKYFLADYNNLIPFADDLNGKNLWKRRRILFQRFSKNTQVKQF